MALHHTRLRTNMFLMLEVCFLQKHFGAHSFEVL